MSRLDHNLQLDNDVIPVTQEADTVELPIQVVVLHGQAEWVADKRHSGLYQPGPLPVIEKDQGWRDHARPIRGRERERVDELVRVEIDRPRLILAMRITYRHREMGKAERPDH